MSLDLGEETVDQVCLEFAVGSELDHLDACVQENAQFHYRSFGELIWRGGFNTN